MLPRHHPPASPFLQALTTITDVRVIQYALTLLRDFLEADPERRARLLSRPGAASNAGAAAGAPGAVLPLLQLVGTSGSGARLLSSEANPYVVEQAALAAAHLVSAEPTADDAATSALLSWALTNMRLFGATSPRQLHVAEVAIEALMVLLRSEYLRALLLEDRGVERLLPLLSARNTQIVYDAGFCLWFLSLHRPAAGAAAPTGVEELARSGAVAALAAACRIGQPMKVQRVVLGALANVCRGAGVGAGAAAQAELAQTHLPDLLAGLLALDPRVPDPELYEDAKYLRDALAAAGGGGAGAGAGAGGSGYNGALTSVDKLERELAAGKLAWGPLHTADFWKENALRVERDGDFAVVKRLAELLSEEGVDAVTQAVALHDLGEFAAQHPQGRSIVVALGAKPAVMALLRRAEGDVKHQALLALSKIMVRSWAFVGGAGGEGEGKRA